MADDVDLAQIEIEMELARARSPIRTARLFPTAHCHNCEEPVGDGQLFCDVDCGIDYEKRERQLAPDGI